MIKINGPTVGTILHPISPCNKTQSDPSQIQTKCMQPPVLTKHYHRSLEMMVKSEIVP